MVDLYELTSFWNNAYGTKYKPTSNRLVAAGERCSNLGLTAKDIIEWRKETGIEGDLVDNMNKFAIDILQAKEAREAKAQEAATRSATAGVPEAVQGLGLLEQTLVTFIVNSTPEILENMMKTVDELVKDKYGPIERAVKYVVPDRAGGDSAEVQDPNFPKVLQLVLAGHDIHNYPLLVGPAGSGKSRMAEQISKTLGVPFYFTNAVMETYKLSGYMDANGKFQETPFYKAWTEGGVFCLDEMDGSAPEALIDLNGALASGVYPFPVGMVPAHPDFHFIATANTYGLGANAEYVGRYQQDAATLDRFITIEVDYNPEIEMKLARNDTNIVDFVRAFRTACQRAEIKHIVSYRAIINMDAFRPGPEGNGWTPKDIVKHFVVKGMDKDDLRSIVKDLPEGNMYTQGVKELLDER